MGRVVACNGSRVSIAANAEGEDTSLAELWSVGRLVSLQVGDNRVVALVAEMHVTDGVWGEDKTNVFVVEAELMGEIYRDADGTERFSSGLSQYPHLGATAHRIRSSDLSRVYESRKGETAVIGALTQDQSISATIHVPSMLSKHFAVVGSTGVGKSTAVSLLLRKAVESDPRLRVLILDPHNEFSSAFPDLSVDIDTDKLDLPFWLFRLEEFSEVLFRGRPAVSVELDALRDLIPEAKKAFRGTDGSFMRRNSDKSSVTADTPVPYRLSDLLALLDERIGRLEGREEKPFLRALKLRIMAAVNDPRYRFMFSSSTITDTINETIAHIFRIPGDGRPISIFQLAGIPSEVVNSVASVLCRMAFEIGLWSNGGVHVLVVCEEAHRYVPADPNLGFFPTRQSIARIAKEGRKYGVSLGIVTQRPGELDQTILSQCSTVFAMRLSNESDQEIIRKAIPESSMSATNFISSIGNGEAIAFGEAVAVPMRLKFNRVAENQLPKATGVAASLEPDEGPETVRISEIVERMRSIAGPDISAFQNALSNQLQRESETMLAQQASLQPALALAPAAEAPVPARTSLPKAEPAAPRAESGLEPYNPAMLPGGRPDGVTPGRVADSPSGAPSSGAGVPDDRDVARQAAALREARQAMAEQAGEPPRSTHSSLRESLLKRPSGSLFRR